MQNLIKMYEKTEIKKITMEVIRLLPTEFMVNLKWKLMPEAMPLMNINCQSDFVIKVCHGEI
jgi:hypothetical protein